MKYIYRNLKVNELLLRNQTVESLIEIKHYFHKNISFNFKVKLYSKHSLKTESFVLYASCHLQVRNACSVLGESVYDIYILYTPSLIQFSLWFLPITKQF